MLEARPGRTCVLVVDDDDAVVDAAAVMLEDDGYAVLVAYGAEQAWLTMQKHAPLPDVVLLGVSAPGGDGWLLMQRVREEPTISHIPVIVMSELDSSVLTDPAVAAYVSKPLAFEPLLETIRLTLWRHGREVPAARDCSYVSDYPQ